jgi:hypothetical protein
VLGGHIAPHRLEAVEALTALLSAGAAAKGLKVKMVCPHGELLRLILEVPAYASRYNVTGGHRRVCVSVVCARLGNTVGKGPERTDFRTPSSPRQSPMASLYLSMTEAVINHWKANNNAYAR